VDFHAVFAPFVRYPRLLERPRPRYCQRSSSPGANHREAGIHTHSMTLCQYKESHGLKYLTQLRQTLATRAERLGVSCFAVSRLSCRTTAIMYYGGGETSLRRRNNELRANDGPDVTSLRGMGCSRAPGLSLPPLFPDESRIIHYSCSA